LDTNAKEIGDADMPGTTPDINANSAAITFPSDKVVAVRVTTNSPTRQRVTISQNNQPPYTFEGYGERNLIGLLNVNFTSSVNVVFEYQSGGNWLKPKLQAS